MDTRSVMNLSPNDNLFLSLCMKHRDTYPGTGDFPLKGPVTLRFEIFFVVRLNNVAWMTSL